jgi:hypothetical protein
MNEQTETKTEKNVDEYFVKLSPAPTIIKDTLNIDDEVAVALVGTVTKIEDTTNNDGTINRTFVVKGKFASAITQPKTGEPKELMTLETGNETLDELLNGK